MKIAPAALLATAVLALHGCHIYQPTISQRVKAKELARLDLNECISEPVQSIALKRACLKLRDIERARAQHQGVIATTGTLLIPIASYVTYRSARDLSSAATTGLALSGLGAYTTIGFLTPDGRIEAYTRGSAAVSCALGLYGVAVASAPRAVFQRAAYEQELKAAQATVKQGDTAKQRQIDTIKSAVQASGATTLLDAQLDRFVYLTVEDLNKLLRGTLPTLASLASDVGVLSGAITDSQSAGIRSDDFQDLRDAALALIDAEKGQRVSADFSSCSMSTAALTQQGLYKPLALGPGNVMDKRTVTLEKDKPTTVPIVGGLTPFGFNVVGADQASRPDVQITMQGTVLLTVTLKEQDTKDSQTHVVSIYDSVGTERTLNVIVPKKSQ